MQAIDVLDAIIYFERDGLKMTKHILHPDRKVKVWEVNFASEKEMSGGLNMYVFEHLAPMRAVNGRLIWKKDVWERTRKFYEDATN